MSGLAVAMDLGTSGLRAQAIDLQSGEVLSTVITSRHPLPGANVIDHLHFALELGVKTASTILVGAINRVIHGLRVEKDQVVRFGICGNPTQLSIFQNMEIRDLAYAGSRKLAALGVEQQERPAAVLVAGTIPGLDLPSDCEVLIPPSIRHEVGADALAMILQTGMLERDETALATDFGTNAEIALYHEGRIFTGSTAAGPALEGQQIGYGMLAAPGAVADLLPEPPYHRLVVLNDEMLPVSGPRVDFGHQGYIDEPVEPVPQGITGTGTIALMSLAMDAGLIALPHIVTRDRKLHLGDEICFTEEDVQEAGKAFGAVRAGHIALCHEAKIALKNVRTAYVTGASGTYMDVTKARKLGLIPPHVKTVYQLGNTSLAMAREIVQRPDLLWEMGERADCLKQSHCMLASSKAFKQVYLLELSTWTEGMPAQLYRRFLKKYHLPDLPEPMGTPQIIRPVSRDIDNLGKMGLVTIADIGRTVEMDFPGCVACRKCMLACPEGALSAVAVGADRDVLVLDEARCSGVKCRRCEKACPEKVLALDRFFMAKGVMNADNAEKTRKK